MALRKIAKKSRKSCESCQKISWFLEISTASVEAPEENLHHITIPRHKTLKVGTLNGILQDVAGHLGIEKEEILKNR